MNIIITFYFNGPALGVAIYARELLIRLIPLLVAEERTVEVWCSTDAYNYLSSEERLVKFCSMEPKLDRIISRVKFLIALPFRQSTQSIILHLTNPFTPPISRLHKSKVVSVIHDLNEFDQHDKYGIARSFFRRILLTSAIKNSHSIICISKHSESQVLNHFPLTGNISVIYNGAGTSLPLKARKPNKNILMVGRLDPTGKNLWSALNLLDRWHATDNEITVTLTGGINKSSENDANEFLAVLKNRKFIQYVGRTSDEELSMLYATAEFLLFFSKYEGFGLPAFEALRSYCPVVAHTCNKALLELLPDEVIYTNEAEDLSIDQIRKRILKIDWINSRNSTMKYSWERTAVLYANHLLG